MLNKKIIITLTFLILAIGAISSVSASDLNTTDAAVAVENEEVTLTDTYDNLYEIDADNDTISEGETEAKVVPVNTEADYKTGNVSFQLTDLNGTPIAESNLNLVIYGTSTIGFKVSATTDENGIATYSYDDLAAWNSGDDGNIVKEKLIAGENYNTKLTSDNNLIKLQSNSQIISIKQTIVNLTAPDVISYGSESQIAITLVNAKTGLPLKNERIAFTINALPTTNYIYTNANGMAFIILNSLNPGKYTLNVSAGDDVNMKNTSASATLTVKKLTIKPTKLTTTYKSGATFKVKVVDNDGKGVKGVKLKLVIYTGSKTKTVYVTTGSNGQATYKASTLSKGTHKVMVYSANSSMPASKVASSIKINPKTLKIYTKSYKYKDASIIIVGVGANKKTPYDSIKVKAKVYTGKKYKTYNLVTGYSKDFKDHGLSYIISNKFSAGTHKVKLTITSANYKGSATGKLVITKSASKSKPKFTAILVKGKTKYYA